MRIWIVNHYALPPSGTGGTRHYNFARLLQEKGHEVVIIAANFNHLSRTTMVKENQRAQWDTSSDVPFVWLPVPAYKGNTIARFWNMIVFNWRLLRNHLLRTLPTPDVIIGSSPHLFAALGAERLASRFKKPFILEIRDLWPESLVDLGHFTHKHPFIKTMKWLESYLYKKATRVISLLPNAKQYFIERGVQATHIVWLPNSVDVEKIPVLPERVKNAKFTVMYAGAHGATNDLETLISAAALLEQKGLSSQIKICLIGDGPEKSRLKQLASDAELTMVEFMDSVPKNAIYAKLNEADVFLMSLKDSPVFRWGISPNKLFDYLIMQRPVIFGVNTPFNPVDSYQAGISIRPENPEALAAAIEQLSLTSPEELDAMGSRGKEFVLENHYLPRLTHELENLLLTVCKQGN